MTEYRAMQVKFYADRRKTWRTVGYGVFPVPLSGAPRMVAGYHGPFARVRARLAAARRNRKPSASRDRLPETPGRLANAWFAILIVVLIGGTFWIMYGPGRTWSNLRMWMVIAPAALVTVAAWSGIGRAARLVRRRLAGSR